MFGHKKKNIEWDDKQSIGSYFKIVSKPTMFGPEYNSSFPISRDKERKITKSGCTHSFVNPKSRKQRE